MGTLRCFETGCHFLVELTETPVHYYCSLLTNVPVMRNFGKKNGSGYLQILMDFRHKSYLFGGIEMEEN
jgi:hypothetical protein